MAKEDMLCPFSGELCRECPLYRGRHYYLCFSKKYRGHLEGSERVTKGTNPGTSEAEPDKQFEAPVKMPSAIDPFKRPLADIKE
jgi:hypothetical protein